MIDRIECLLVDKRLDERERIKKDFAPFGDVRFFLAGNGSANEEYGHIDVPLPANHKGTYPAWLKRPNSYNAFLCFRKMITLARDDGIETLLLLEDDAVPVAVARNIGLPDKYVRFLQEERPEWGMFYLGANNFFAPVAFVNDYTLRLNGSGCFHAVLLHRRVFAAILDLPAENPIDGVVAKKIHPQFECYGAWPNLVVTRPGFSHCEGRHVFYGKMFSELQRVRQEGELFS